MDGLAIERQREDCENLARYRRWDVMETYVDQSISASDRTKRRSAYERMVADYEAGLLDAIVCYDLDRLTRQPRELEDWIDRAERRGLLLVTADGDADLSTDGGRMFALIKAAVARAEVERKGARQSRAQLQRARQGRVPKGGAPMWCVKRRRVVSWLVVGRRGLHLGSWRAGSGCGGGPGRERPGYDACPGLVCAGSRPGRRGRSAGRRRRRGTWRA